jgi:hypothetical protein
MATVSEPTYTVIAEKNLAMRTRDGITRARTCTVLTRPGNSRCS